MKRTNLVYTGANGRKSLIDFEYENDFNKTIILFVHGYKGFKDWGAWNQVQNFFVSNGFGFSKLNLSHNGGTIDNGIDFPDLEAFGENRYSYEKQDIDCAIDFLKENVKFEQLILIGHSRGGADVILAEKNENVSAIVTWSSISNIAERFVKGEELDKWKNDGVRYIKNGRTNQKMPHLYSFYEDFLANKEEMNLQNILETTETAYLHIHGTNDEAVPHAESEDLAKWSEGDLILINDANHVFGAKQPWGLNYLPDDLEEVCLHTLDWIQSLEY